ncbi:MAG: NTP transferase domain-containing protein [Candidatus Omnitrophica bacterium]|nr:NTP transferase domain-containing protein [Candidatus Omnitrophota bacterium]
MKKKSNIIGAIFCGREGQKAEKSERSLAHNRILMEEILNTLAPFCKEVVLVGQVKQIPDHFSHLKIVPNNYDHCGHLGNIEALLNSDLAPEYLTAPSDLHNPDPKIFKLLMSHEGQSPVIVSYKNKTHPLIGLYPASLKAIATQHIAYNNLSMDNFLATCQAECIDITNILGKDLMNVKSEEHKIKK